MLKRRLLTAALLIILIVLEILYLNSTTLAVIFAIVAALSAWEWAGLSGYLARAQRIGYVAIILFSFILVYSAHSFWPTATTVFLLSAAILWWLIAAYWVLRYQQQCDLLPNSSPLRAGLGGVVLIPSWFAVYQLHQQYGEYWVLFLFVLIWGADTGAYAAGRLWGRHKLASHVSPGKTWEGFAGALLVGALFAGGAAYFWLDESEALYQIGFVLLSLATVVVSVLGDLLESLFKRKAGVKDSGQILPGHGGMLDRIDSLTSAAPFFLAGLLLMGSLS
jgi:phosphatidate cytidylyltransferase